MLNYQEGVGTFWQRNMCDLVRTWCAVCKKEKQRSTSLVFMITFKLKWWNWTRTRITRKTKQELVLFSHYCNRWHFTAKFPLNFHERETYAVISVVTRKPIGACIGVVSAVEDVMSKAIISDVKFKKTANSTDRSISFASLCETSPTNFHATCTPTSGWAVSMCA